MKRKLLTALIAGGALGWGSAANAVLIDFQNGDGAIDVGAVDWRQTSLGVEDGSAAVIDFVTSNGACTGTATNCEFTFYTHAVLTGVTDTSGNIVNPTGINQDWEVTVTMRVRERVTAVSGVPGVGGTQADFATVPDGEFLEMWYDDSVDINDVQGHGFNNGRLILTGSEVGAATGSFQILGDTAVQLDQFPSNNAASDDYGDGSGNNGSSQLTLPGQGSNTTLVWDQLTQDNTFFLEQLDVFGVLFQNISVGLPFGTVNPSDCFTGVASGLAVTQSQAAGHDCAATHVDGLMSANPDALGGFVPTINNVNGAPIVAGSVTGGGPDFIAQTDFNGSFQVEPVPEPAGLALVGLGLLGIGVARRRRR